MRDVASQSVSEAAKWRDVFLPATLIVGIFSAILFLLPFLLTLGTAPGALFLYFSQVAYLAVAAVVLGVGLARFGQVPLSHRLGRGATVWDAGLLTSGALLGGLVPIGFLSFQCLVLFSADVGDLLKRGLGASLGTLFPLALCIAFGGTGLGFLLNYLLHRLGLGLTLIKVVDAGIVILAGLLSGLLFKNVELPLALVPLYVPVLALLAAPTGMVASFPTLRRR